VNFFTTASYTYYKIIKLAVQCKPKFKKKIHHGKIGLAVEFESNNE